jgi:hypothetical protein
VSRRIGEPTPSRFRELRLMLATLEPLATGTPAALLPDRSPLKLRCWGPVSCSPGWSSGNEPKG